METTQAPWSEKQALVRSISMIIHNEKCHVMRRANNSQTTKVTKQRHRNFGKRQQKQGTGRRDDIRAIPNIYFLPAVVHVGVTDAVYPVYVLLLTVYFISVAFFFMNVSVYRKRHANIFLFLQLFMHILLTQPVSKIVLPRPEHLGCQESNPRTAEQKTNTKPSVYHR